MKNVSDNIMISSLINNEGKVRVKMRTWDNLLETGNMVKISRVS